MQKLSVGLSVLLIVAYAPRPAVLAEDAPGVLRERRHAEADEAPWPIGLALAMLAGVTVLVALVSQVFVESVQEAAETFGMTPAFVGFIVVALVAAPRKWHPRFPARARTGSTSASASHWAAPRRSRSSSRRCWCC